MNDVENNEVTKSDEIATNQIAVDDLTNVLKKAGQKAVAQKNKRHEQIVKGAHLLEKLRSKAVEDGLTVEDKSGFIKITGTAKSRAVYLAKKGGRVDLSGFSIDNVAINNISEEEAKNKHIGRVRGQINFDKTDEEVLAAYDIALSQLK